MRLRDWFRDDVQPARGGDAPSPAELDHLRQVSRELLSAGEDAINRALSGDSKAFLAAIRQEGGQ